MSITWLYLGLSVLGAIAGLWAAGMLWTGHEPGLVGFALVLASVPPLLVFIINEGRWFRAPRLIWLPLAATLCAGPACGLPLFLYLRQAELDRAERSD